MTSKRCIQRFSCFFDKISWPACFRYAGTQQFESSVQTDEISFGLKFRLSTKVLSSTNKWRTKCECITVGLCVIWKNWRGGCANIWRIGTRPNAVTAEHISILHNAYNGTSWRRKNGKNELGKMLSICPTIQSNEKSQTFSFDFSPG